MNRRSFRLYTSALLVLLAMQTTASAQCPWHETTPLDACNIGPAPTMTMGPAFRFGRWWCDEPTAVADFSPQLPGIDRSHKPWSITPQDGYVGAARPDAELLKENAGDDYENEGKPEGGSASPPETPAIPEKPTPPGTEKKPNEEEICDPVEVESDATPGPEESSLSPQPINVAFCIGRAASYKLYPPSSKLSPARPPVTRAVPARQAVVDDTVESNRAGYSLVLACLVALAVAGNFARRQWTVDHNEVPIIKI